MRRRSPLAALVLLIAGCLAPTAPAVLIDGRVDVRLRTTQRHGLFLTNLRLDNVDAGPFVLDTGSYSVVLDVELARRLGLRYSREAHQYGHKGGFTTVRSLQAGPVTLRNTAVGVLDLSAIAPALGERLAGILGYPFFAETVVEFDYGSQSVSCFARAAYHLPEAQWQPLILRERAPAVVARLDGNIEGTFMLDTGSTATVHLSPAFLEKHSRLQIRDVRRTRSIGIAGEREASEGRIGWFEVGGRRFQGPRVVFSRTATDSDFEGTASRVHPAFDGIIGYGFMRHFVVVFNYPAAKIAFLPVRPPRPGGLAEHHPLEGLRVADAAALAVAHRPRLQELIHPLALADLRAVGLERATLRAERAADVHEYVGVE